MSHKRNGFTLYESLVVVLILGIFAGLSVPSFWRSLSNYRADLASQQLQSDIKLASKLARTQGKQQKVIFSDNGYLIDGYADPQRKQNTKQVRFDEAPWFVTLNSSQAEITFDMYGEPANGGTWTINQGTLYQRVVKLKYPSGEVVK